MHGEHGSSCRHLGELTPEGLLVGGLQVPDVVGDGLIDPFDEVLHDVLHDRVPLGVGEHRPDEERVRETPDGVPVGPQPGLESTLRGPLEPLLDGAEGAVGALRGPRDIRVPGEALTEHSRGQNAFGHLRSPRHEVRLRCRFAGDPIGVPEVVLVVLRVAADGDRVGEVLLRPTRTSDALLVVEPLRRHVRHHHAVQTADVNAGLHRRGHAQHIDGVGEIVLPELLESDALEEPLTATLHLGRTGLRGQLRGRDLPRFLLCQGPIVAASGLLLIDLFEVPSSASRVRADPTRRVHVEEGAHRAAVELPVARVHGERGVGDARHDLPPLVEVDGHEAVGDPGQQFLAVETVHLGDLLQILPDRCRAGPLPGGVPPVLPVTA